MTCSSDPVCTPAWTLSETLLFTWNCGFFSTSFGGAAGKVFFYGRWRTEHGKQTRMSEKKISLPPSLADQFIVLIGLMGAGKSHLGRQLATATGLPFKDTDNEVEKAAGCSIEEIFDRYGEADFRAGEKRVIARLFQDKPSIIATGGGSFINDETRRLIKNRGVSIWLRADLDLLYRRTQNRLHRPLLNQGNGREILAQLMKERYPIYAHADIIFDVRDESAPESAERLIGVLINFGEQSTAASLAHDTA